MDFEERKKTKALIKLMCEVLVAYGDRVSSVHYKFDSHQ